MTIAYHSVLKMHVTIAYNSVEDNDVPSGVSAQSRMVASAEHVAMALALR